MFCYCDVYEVLKSGEYDVFVMIEMVKLKDVLLYKDSIVSVVNWVVEVISVNFVMQVFLYESWYVLDDQLEWLGCFFGDLDQMWSQILWLVSCVIEKVNGKLVWLILVGQVMVVVVVEVEVQGIVELIYCE